MVYLTLPTAKARGLTTHWIITSIYHTKPQKNISRQKYRKRYTYLYLLPLSPPAFSVWILDFVRPSTLLIVLPRPAKAVLARITRITTRNKKGKKKGMCRALAKATPRREQKENAEGGHEGSIEVYISSYTL